MALRWQGPTQGGRDLRPAESPGRGAPGLRSGRRVRPRRVVMSPKLAADRPADRAMRRAHRPRADLAPVRRAPGRRAQPRGVRHGRGGRVLPARLGRRSGPAGHRRPAGHRHPGRHRGAARVRGGPVLLLHRRAQPGLRAVRRGQHDRIQPAAAGPGLAGGGDHLAVGGVPAVRPRRPGTGAAVRVPDRAGVPVRRLHRGVPDPAVRADQPGPRLRPARLLRLLPVEGLPGRGLASRSWPGPPPGSATCRAVPGACW